MARVEPGSRLDSQNANSYSFAGDVVTGYGC